LNPPKGAFSEFFAIFEKKAEVHILGENCDEIAGDIPTQFRKLSVGMKFLALNSDFSISSLDPLGSRRPAQASFKEGYPLISGYFTAISLTSVKTVADVHRNATYRNKHC